MSKSHRERVWIKLEQLADQMDSMNVSLITTEYSELEKQADLLRNKFGYKDSPANDVRRGNAAFKRKARRAVKRKDRMQSIKDVQSSLNDQFDSYYDDLMCPPSDDMFEIDYILDLIEEHGTICFATKLCN